MSAADLSPAVVRDEEKIPCGVCAGTGFRDKVNRGTYCIPGLHCDCCHGTGWATPASIHAASASPVSVPEERQDDPSIAKLNGMCEAVATVEDLVQARNLLSALCNGEFTRWRMCVPVQRDDSDIVLSRVILTAGRYVKLQSALDALAVAVKPVRELAEAESRKRGSYTELLIDDVPLYHLIGAITALLDGRTTHG